MFFNVIIFVFIFELNFVCGSSEGERGAWFSRTARTLTLLAPLAEDSAEIKKNRALPP